MARLTDVLLPEFLSLPGEHDLGALTKELEMLTVPLGCAGSSRQHGRVCSQASRAAAALLLPRDYECSTSRKAGENLLPLTSLRALPEVLCFRGAFPSPSNALGCGEMQMNWHPRGQQVNGSLYSDFSDSDGWSQLLPSWTGKVRLEQCVPVRGHRRRL